MLIEKLNMERIPEFHNKIRKSGATFWYNLDNSTAQQFNYSTDSKNLWDADKRRLTGSFLFVIFD